MAAVSIVNGNVWVNMWATAYVLFVSTGTKGPVVNIYIYLFMLFISCRYANPDFDRLRTNRIRLNIYREGRNFVLCYRH